MLRVMSGHEPGTVLSGERDPGDHWAHAVWTDLLEPSDEERAQVERATGLRVPVRHDIAEIETSSRLVNDGGVLYLSTPMIGHTASGLVGPTPVGFVVTQQRLVTVRFAGSMVFDKFADAWRAGQPSGVGAFLGLLEAMVDRLADLLEQMGAEMDRLSTEVFALGTDRGRSSRRRDAFLQATLAETGRRGAHLSQLRDGLLGIGRIVRFVPEAAADWLEEAERRRLVTLDRDVVSLTDYETQLAGRVQFLLDATLGFIGIEQNNTIKVLTVVSIVGIPPTFIASLYGMNFHNMPELGWKYGYQYGLSLIALSVVAPLVLFWRRGWL